jgi:hypothetical protein
MNRQSPLRAGCLVSAALLFATSMPATAQYRDNLGGNWNNAASASITNIIMDRMARRRLEERLAGKKPGAPAAVPAAAFNDAAVRFHSTGTQLRTREIAGQLGGSDGASKMYPILSAILREYEIGARGAGKPNDLALALSFFFSTNATVYHDAPVPPDAQVMDLRNTIAGALVEGGALNGVTDREKQGMYEALVLYTGLALAGSQEAKRGHDAQSLKTYRQLAGMNLQAVTHVSPDKITFTGQGLNIESATVAVVPAEGQAVAAAASSNAPAVSWARMIKDYEDNEVGADAKYTGKRIRVVGPFRSAEVSGGQIIVWFNTPAATYSHFACYFPSSRRASLVDLHSGQEIVVDGISRGLKKDLGRVALDDCVLRS